MKRMALLFSHDLTKEQIKEANERFNVVEFIKLPEKLQVKWSNVPPEGELNELYFDDFKKFIEENLKEGDFVLIQGDFGATLYMVNWAFKKRFVPVYATTVRKYESFKDEDGSVKNIHYFKHVNFRLYKME